ATLDLAAFWVMCVLLAEPLKHAGVALATSAGFWINFLALAVLLRVRVGRLGGRELVASLLRLTLATLVMASAVFAAAQWLVPYDPAWRFVLRVAWLFSFAAAGVVIFFWAASLFGASETGEILGALRRRKAAA